MKQPNWSRADRERLRAAENLYAEGVTMPEKKECCTEQNTVMATMRIHQGGTPRPLYDQKTGKQLLACRVCGTVFRDAAPSGEGEA